MIELRILVYAKKFEIRNSTAEFLTFVAEGKEQGVQVLYNDERYGQHKRQWLCSSIALQIIVDGLALRTLSFYSCKIHCIFCVSCFIVLFMKCTTFAELSDVVIVR